MKKQYLTPFAEPVPIIGIERPLCTSDELTPLQEDPNALDEDEMGWIYNG